MGLAISFWILAALAIVAAIGVLTLGSVFRAALSLVLCLLAVAGLYVTLSADFIAIVQVLIYVGAISVLIILAVLLTHDVTHSNLPNRIGWPAAAVAAVFAVMMITVVTATPWVTSTAEPLTPTIGGLANRLFSPDGYLLALEIAAVLLLMAVIAAIALVREK